MRISDWSSDVGSSDLVKPRKTLALLFARLLKTRLHRRQDFRAMLFQLAQHRVRPHAKHTGIPKETARFQILPGELKRGLFDKAHRALAIGLDIAVAGFRRAG